MLLETNIGVIMVRGLEGGEGGDVFKKEARNQLAKL